MSLTPAVDRDGYKIRADGTVLGRRGRAMVPEIVKGGYLRVKLAGRHHLVHVLVAEAFIGTRPIGLEVNHRDGDKANNGVENLEYVTPSQNVRHSIDVLRVVRAPGAKNANSKLTDDQVRAMRADHVAGMPAAEVGRRYGIDATHAWRIVTGQSWRHVA